ncbi:MAG: hypothetical protein NTW29_22745 [Bacteroidetes bacterium]|nr:hypothetical protein [Bacteroidota bacterium]
MIDIIILLFLAILCIARGTWGLFKDIRIDLADASTVTGQVIQADIKQMEQVTFEYNKYKTVFALQLHNSNQQFAIDRGADFCNSLSQQIKIGDTVTILYRLSTVEHNTHVFQIEKNGKVIAGLTDYKSGELRMIILGYVFGCSIITGLAIWRVKRRRKARMIQT